jgi:hypothetical protein
MPWPFDPQDSVLPQRPLHPRPFNPEQQHHLEHPRGSIVIIITDITIITIIMVGE